MHMRVILITFLLFSLSAFGFCEGRRITVNGISLGMCVGLVKKKLYPFCEGYSILPWIGKETSDLSGFQEPVLHMLTTEGKVVALIGDQVEINNMPVVKRGASISVLQKAFGDASCVDPGNYLGLGDESPVKKLLFFQEDFTLEVLISNDDFIYRRIPTQVFKCGKVWRFRVWSHQLSY